jgi:excisionase family DNA binding protein
MLLSVREVCVLLHRSKARVYEMIHMRELGHLRDGRSILIPREALDEWIRRKRRQSGC